MAKYAQIIKGKVHGVFEYDPLPEFAPNIVMVPIDGVTPEPKAGWLYDGQDFSEPPAPPEPDLGTRITRLAMRNRFTFSEKVAIEDAAKSDIEVKVFMDDLSSSSFVDLSREDTQQGVGLLQSKGLITESRANEILNDPVQAIEVPE